jgi:outer membrane protein TolC
MSYGLRPKTTISGDVLGAPGTELVVSQDSGEIAVVANWSLFNGGQVTGEIRAAEAQLHQAEKNLETLQLQVQLDVMSAYFMLRSAASQVKAAQKEVDQANEAHRIAVLRYQEGVSTSVEVLDAEASLGGAKTRLNSAIYGLNLAVASLDLAAGRQWAPAGQSSVPASQK